MRKNKPPKAKVDRRKSVSQLHIHPVNFSKIEVKDLLFTQGGLVERTSIQVATDVIISKKAFLVGAIIRQGNYFYKILQHFDQFKYYAKRYIAQ